ncbi:MAG: hypothetical protein ACE5G0_15210 [Rhodothermales bacterium]
MKKQTLIGLFFLAGLFVVLGLVGCDTDISGTALENQAPETHLSVRDSSLVDNLAGADRLASTVFVAWSGTDPDGFVASFELRFYPGDTPPSGPEEGWASTTRNDTLVLLPIPRGERIADVVFEVRAIDNERLKDPTPARTVFPIQNAPPTIRLSTFDAPPDTTFTVFSFSWTADDPEGKGNLDRIEVSLNDSTRFTALAPDVEFITLIGLVDRADPAQSETEAEVFLGKAFQRTTLRLPGLRLDADNTFYVRSVDQTDTTSTVERYSWHVKKPKGDVLFVNDVRKASAPTVASFHREVLGAYLPEGTNVDFWDVSLPFVTGAGGNALRSDAIPKTADPTLRQTLALFRYIYWVSSNTTNSTVQNNLPFAASVMDLFFENGGKIMVLSPVTLPGDPSESLSNPAVLLLPMSDLIVFPDSLRPTLRMPTGSGVNPVGALPGVAEALPPMKSRQFIIGTLPYITATSNTIPLYEGEFLFITRVGGRQGAWPGPATVASITTDRRIGLFSLPLVNEQTGAATFEGSDGDSDAPQRAIHLMLESLGFPKR